MKQPKRWTAQEDAIVRKLETAEAMEILGRSRAAINQRRFNLRHPECIERAKNPLQVGGWSPADTELLREKFVTVKCIRDLVDVFGGRLSVLQIKGKARKMGLKRKFAGDARLTGHMEIIDQIRIRAKEDGIPIYKLDRICGMRSYFSDQAIRAKINLTAVARAVEFFGGQLVIQWNDR